MLVFRGVPIFVKKWSLPQFYHQKIAGIPTCKNFRYLKWRNPVPAILGVGFSLHKALHTAYIGEDSYIHVRYLKFILVYRRSIILQTRHPSCRTRLQASQWLDFALGALDTTSRRGTLEQKTKAGGLAILYWLVVSKIFYVHPYLEKIPNWTNIFQRGWNHQLVWYII